MDDRVESLEEVLVNTSLVLMLVEMIQSSMSSPQSTSSFFLPDVGVETTHATTQYLLVSTTMHQYRLSSNLEIIFYVNLVIES